MVSGVPVVVEGLADAVQNSIFVLLAAALLVMAARCAGVPHAAAAAAARAGARRRRRSSTAAWRWSGGTLTMASIAVLPVLIGLAVDYAIQFQARFDEQRRAARPPRRAAAAAAAAGGPTIAAAALATAAGFLMLLLSPVPMVRDFGAMLVRRHRAGASACALTAGLRALVRWRAGRGAGPSDVPPRACRGPRARGARTSGRLRRVRRGALRPPAAG